jgi:murein DD-endopeptidase MepM/ murein hydrolase activator NlpD
MYLMLLFLTVSVLGCTQSGSLDVLSLPIDKQDVSFRYTGIWPYGVQGGDHPHGHPGIDFESEVGNPILAVDDGIITVLQTNVGEYGEDTLSFISDSLGSYYEIYYTGSLTDFQVQEGDRVNRGDILAYYRAWREPDGTVLDSGYIHFEVHTRSIEQGGSNCPYNFMNDEAKRELDELLSNSTYEEKPMFPLICNACPEGGCY